MRLVANAVYIQALELAQQANAVISQFQEDIKERPDLAWEQLVTLQELLDRMRRIHPARAFRTSPPSGQAARAPSLTLLAAAAGKPR